MTKDEIELLIDEGIQINPDEIKDKTLRAYYVEKMKAAAPDQEIKPEFRPAVDINFSPIETIKKLPIPEVN